MLQPDLKRLRNEVRRAFSLPENNDWTPLDWCALATALAAAVGVHFQIRREFPSTGLGEHVLVLGLAFIATATVVYGLWYLPLLAIQFLKRFWWVVILAFGLLLAWVNLRALI